MSVPPGAFYGGPHNPPSSRPHGGIDHRAPMTTGNVGWDGPLTEKRGGYFVHEQQGQPQRPNSVPGRPGWERQDETMRPRIPKPRTVEELMWLIRKRTERRVITDSYEERKDVSDLMQNMAYRLGKDTMDTNPLRELEDVKRLCFFWMSICVKLQTGAETRQTWEQLYAQARYEDIPAQEWSQFISDNMSKKAPDYVPSGIHKGSSRFGSRKRTHLDVQSEIDFFKRLVFRWMVLALKMNRVENKDDDFDDFDWEEKFEECFANRFKISYWPTWIEATLDRRIPPPPPVQGTKK